MASELGRKVADIEMVLSCLNIVVAADEKIWLYDSGKGNLHLSTQSWQC